MRVCVRVRVCVCVRACVCVRLCECACSVWMEGWEAGVTTWLTMPRALTIVRVKLISPLLAAASVSFTHGGLGESNPSI